MINSYEGIMVLNWADMSPYFGVNEIFSPDTRGQWSMVDIPALLTLNKFRESLGVPLMVNFGRHTRRGYRSCREQRDLIDQGLTKARFSLHCLGKAFDVSSSKVNPSYIFKAAKEFGWTGIGLYPSFVHVDLRVLTTHEPIIWIVE